MSTMSRTAAEIRNACYIFLYTSITFALTSLYWDAPTWSKTDVETEKRPIANFCCFRRLRSFPAYLFKKVASLSTIVLKNEQVKKKIITLICNLFLITLGLNRNVKLSIIPLRNCFSTEKIVKTCPYVLIRNGLIANNFS